MTENFLVADSDARTDYLIYRQNFVSKFAAKFKKAKNESNLVSFSSEYSLILSTQPTLLHCKAPLSSREQQLCSSTSVTSRNLYLDQNFAATTVASGDIIARQTRQILWGKNLQNDVDQSISSISSHPQLSNCTKKFFIFVNLYEYKIGGTY